jgi:hypothetical protein
MGLTAHRARSGHARLMSDLEHGSCCFDHDPERALHGGAGDENRTRTISLGTRPERPLSALACYTCTSGPSRRPTDAPESGPVRTVCETSVRRRARMIKLSELGTRRVENARDQRPHAIRRGDGQPARAFGHLRASCAAMTEVLDLTAEPEGAS